MVKLPRYSRYSMVLLSLLFILAASTYGENSPVVIPGSKVLKPAGNTNIIDTLDAIPLYFIQNYGQVDSTIRYYNKGQNRAVFFTGDGLITQYLQYTRETPSRNIENRGKFSMDTTPIHVKGVNLHMKMVGCNLNPVITSLEELPGKMNYLLGNDSSRWHSNVPIFQKVLYENVYPGINLVYKGTGGNVEYDYVVAPGARPESIRFEILGADKLDITPEGDLAIQTPLGTCIQKKPKTYQENSLGIPSEVTSGFVMTPEHQIAFHVPSYDKSKSLIIDPLIYSTYLGGNSSDIGDIGYGIAVDNSGNAYVTGYTASTDFPTTVGVFDTILNGNYDAYVTKLNPSGTGIVYSTYLGGSDSDYGYAIAVDTGGNAYVTGFTYSTNFPTTDGAFERNPHGYDVYVTKLNATGTGLAYSTFLGYGYGYSIAVNNNGNAYVTGYTIASNFPTTTGAFDTTYDNYDGYVTKLNPAGTGLEYSTFLGGTDADFGQSIAIDSIGNAYVTGYTYSSDFPTTTGAYDTVYNDYDAFVTKLNPTGTGLLYSTFLGGSSNDFGYGIAIDVGGNAYVTGMTQSSGFPTTSGALDRTYNSNNDGFVTKVNPAGTGLVYSTFLGGSKYDAGKSIAVDMSGNAYIAGITESTNFPTTNGAYDKTYNGGYEDVFVTKLNPAGNALVYSTYLGGSESDRGFSMAMDKSGNVYVTGDTQSSNFPTTSGAYDQTYNSVEDAIVFKLACYSNTLYAVTNMQAIAGDKSVSLSWSNPTSSDYSATLIRRRTDTYPDNPTDGTQIFDASGNSFSDTNVVNGVTYYYTAYAHNALNQYAPGDTASATPKYNKYVQNVTVNPNDRQVTLNWSNPTGGSYSATKILRRTDRYPTGPTDGTVVYWFSGTVCNDTGLINGKTYYYGLFTHDTSYSYTTGICVSAMPFYNQNVQNVVLTPGDKKVNLSWTNPAGGSYSATKILRRSDRFPTGAADGTVVYWFNGTVCSDTGLNYGQTYYYALFAHDTAYSYATGVFKSVYLASGDLNSALDTTAWGFQQPGGVSQMPAFSWLSSYSGHTGILKLSYSSATEGLKLTSIARTFNGAGNYWYRIRVQYSSDSPNSGHEIISSLLSYPNPQSYTITEVGGNWTGNGQITPGRWYTYDTFVYSKESSQQIQLMLKNNGSSGDFYIDSIQCDSTTPASLVSPVWVPMTIGDFDTATDTTRWGFQSIPTAANGIGTLSWVSSVGTQNGVIALGYNLVNQGTKMTSSPTYTIATNRNVLMSFKYRSNLSSPTTLHILGYLYGERDLATYKVDIAVKGVLGNFPGNQWNTVYVPLTSVSQNSSFRMQLIIKNNTQSTETVYIDDIQLIYSSTAVTSQQWAQADDVCDLKQPNLYE